MNQHLVSSIAAAGLATTLTGCCIPFTGGCSSGSGTASTSSSPSTTTVTTAVLDTMACSKDSQACAEYLNHLYYGFDENKMDGPLGVPLRGRVDFKEEEPWFFCGGDCHTDDQGTYAFADCNVESSLMNHKVMIHPDSNTPLYNPDAASDYYAYRVFAIFYEDVVREQLMRCAYQYDGATFNRGNGGCGLAMGDNLCEDDVSAYVGKCPDEGSDVFAYQNECQATQDEWCGSDKMKDESYPTICYWKGAAWDSPSNAGAEADMTKLSKTNDELPKMLEQRLGSQETGETDDPVPIPYKVYWNELVIDGRVLNKLLESKPERAIAAWGYIVDGADSDEARAMDEQVLENAKRFRDQHYEKYNVKVPLVSLNVRADVSQKVDVFGPGPEESDDTPTEAPSEGPQLMQFV